MKTIKDSIITFLFFLLVFQVWGQEPINTLDKSGERHGPWIEYYDDSQTQIKFEGQFQHGERTGLFKFYKEGLKQPVALMEFEAATGRVVAQYLSQDGKVISEGEMLDQQRTGIWTYYHNKSEVVMMTEQYEKGKLNGQKKVYYEDGELAEEASYLNGELHGPRKLYSVKGIVLEDLVYQNGKLHGSARFYNGKGELMNEGNYKNNQHHGTWKYYENGIFKEEKDF